MKTGSMGERNRREIATASAVFLAPALLVIAIFIVYPIVQSFITSTYDWNGYSASKAFIGLKNWTKLLADTDFWAAFRNNILVMVLSIVLQMPIGLALATFLNLVGKKGDICKVAALVLLLMFSAFAAYPLSRWRFRLNKPIYSLIVACMSVPIHVTLLPIFLMMTRTGLYDSIWALVGPYVAFNLPVSVFILTTFMASVPKDMEEAAGIDGCGRYNIFWKIMLPLAKPGLATLVIYDGVNIWNEFSFALTPTQTSVNRTLPLAVNEFQGQYTMNIPMIMTVLFISILPMIIVFILFKDKLIEGMMAGAVKG